MTDLAAMLHKAKRNQLVCLMRKVGELWGEDPTWMEDYIVDQVKEWTNTPDRLQSALDCFETLKEYQWKTNGARKVSNGGQNR